MDLQEYLDKMSAAHRYDSLSKSDQLTLGEMILKLEHIQKMHEHSDRKDEATVYYDFEYFFPRRIDSWRGIYAELALDIQTHSDKTEPLKLSEFIKLLKDADGSEFSGYKGGEFVMSKRTPVWVANYGNSGNTAVVEIIDCGYKVIIATGYREAYS